MNLDYAFYVLIAIVVGYVVLVIVAGIWKGWAAVAKIWLWTKKLGWLGLIVVGLIIASVASGKKNKKIKDIDEKLAEANAIEKKTVEDLKKIEKLQEERKAIENEIVGITDKYKKKVDDLKKPELPGDAGKSKDDLDKVW
jgi:septal ring factor EnvC (AmiA/AmiB activator)